MFENSIYREKIRSIVTLQLHSSCNEKILEKKIYELFDNSHPLKSIQDDLEIEYSLQIGQMFDGVADQRIKEIF